MTVRLHTVQVCALCGQSSSLDVVVIRTVRTRPFWELGIDGAGDQLPELETCARCGHCAPEIGHRYAYLVEGDAARRAVLADGTHVPDAARCLAVAMLFADDPLEHGAWLLRAAWADEAAGRFDLATPLRGHALDRLETALSSGRAIDLRRGFSSLILAETARAAGDTTRAAHHACRGLQSAPPDRATQLLLLFELAAVEHGDRLPRTRTFARDVVTSWPSATVRQYLDRAGQPRLRTPLASIAPSATAAELTTFAEDFLTPDMLGDLLRAGHVEPVAAGIRARGLLSSLCDAIRSPDAALRTSGCRTLLADNLALQSLLVTDAELAALVGLLDLRDDDVTRYIALALTRVAGNRLASERSAIAAAAHAALRRPARDRSTEGALERLIETCSDVRAAAVTR